MINSPKWEFPKMPFKYDSQQADTIMKAMILNYRMEDVFCSIEDEEWFVSLSDEEQYKVVKLIAERVEELIRDFDDYHGIAITIAIDEYIQRGG